MKKVLALILVVLMALPLLVACNGNGDPAVTTVAGGNGTTAGNGGDKTPGDTTAGKQEGTTAGNNGTTDPSSGTTAGNPSGDTTVNNVPGGDTTAEALIPEGSYYDGFTFKVLSRVSDLPTGWGNYDIVYDPDSELVVAEIKDAINTRNEALYDTLGVDVEQIKGGFNEAQTALLNNTYEYDMVIVPIADAAKLAQTGRLLHTGELEYIDTTKPWYDQNAIKELAIKGKNYFFFSDITVVNLDATWLFYFNHSMVEKYGLDKPYDLLANDEWTVDKLLDMATAATEDPTSTDKTLDWGLAGHQDLIGSLYVGSGEKIATATDNGYELTMNNERLTKIIEKAIKIRPYWARYSISSATTSADNVLSATADNYSGLMSMYSQGNVLFMAEVLAASRDLTFTETELNIGILPCPMFDDTQDRYYTPVNNIAGITCVPANVDDRERTSIIIEFWAAESHNTLVPAYYDQAQKARFAKDKISEDVLDEIFAARTYDVGVAYGWGELYKQLTALMYDGGDSFASKYRIYGTIANSDIKKFVESFE